jgi:hypothetical protein
MQSRLNKESKAFVKKKKRKVLNTLKEKRQDQINKKWFLNRERGINQHSFLR